ncbi:MAG: hypothetical protein IJY88_01310 [Clostridia bacterium]|nr:hypothetical protein [Clostridia bacterium]
MNENFEPDFTENNVEAAQAPIQPTFAPKENVLAGIVGAFLFSLAGGVVWFLLYQIGYLAALSGIVGVICAIKGYSIFAKRESVKGVVISSVIAFLVIVIAWYLCISYDVYLAYQDWYANGELDFTLTFFESIRAAVLFLEDSEILVAYLKDLGIGLIFCVIGAFGYVKSAIGRAKNN